jgi:hypothetical protein
MSESAYDRTIPGFDIRLPKGYIGPRVYSEREIRLQRTREEIQRAIEKAPVRRGFTAEELSREIKMPRASRIHLETASGIQPEYPEEMYY